MVKIKNWVRVGFGLFLILYFVLAYLMINNPIDFLGVWYICFAAFLIINEVLDNKTAILSIIIGAILLTSSITLLSQKQSISTLDLVIYIGLPLIMIIMGIGVHFRFLPGKILKSN